MTDNKSDLTLSHFPHVPTLATLPPGFSSHVLHQNPLVMRIDHAILDDEIETLIAMAQSKFARSTIVVDGKLIHSSSRTSQTAFVTASGQKGTYAEPVERFIRRIMFLTGCKRGQIEGLMVVKYEPGEQYTNHWDFFEENHTPQLTNGGQRLATFFFYLNDVDKDAGGHTSFSHLDLSIAPKKGSAAFWWNQIDGERLRKTEHSGTTLKEGIKYGLNVWIREHGW